MTDTMNDQPKTLPRCSRQASAPAATNPTQMF